MIKTTRIKRKINKFSNLSQLNIISWNINDRRDRILGSKDTNDAFMDKLEGCHIFCLQETKGEIKIENFRCYNKLRSDSRSGGLCIGIHRDIADYLHIIDTSKYSSDFQVARISGKLIGNSKDVFVVNVYDSPEMSSYKQKKKSNGTYNNTLESLSEFLSSIQSGTNLIILGDFNARTGNLNSFTKNDDLAYQTLCNGDFYRKSHPVTKNRVSKDKIVNERGNKLLDFATEWNISILNGCTFGDVLGDWTCHLYNGNSVVDYSLVAESLKFKTKWIQVMDFNEFSDHKPLKYSLSTSKPISYKETPDINYTTKPPGFRWNTLNHESQNKFINAQSESDVRSALNSLNSTSCYSSDDVYRLNNTLTSVLMTIAEKSLDKRKSLDNLRKRRINKNPWYDHECRQLKRNVTKLSKKYSKAPLDITLREEFYLARKTYKKFITSKKKDYVVKLNLDIETSKQINWDKFKKLKTVNEEGEKLDMFDFKIFFDFFKDLYSKQSLSEDQIADLKKNRTNDDPMLDDNDHLLTLLNEDVTSSELIAVIKKLRQGKASAEDTVLNELHLYSW